MFNVTIQNHGGGENPVEETFGHTLHLKGEYEGQYSNAERYLTMMYESDQAFGGMLDELSGKDEPYIVLMFGDHQVSMGEDQAFVERLCGKSLDSMTEEEREDLYTVPYIMWANYDIEEKVVEERTSINYLRLMLLDQLGMDGSAYDVFLRTCRDAYPAINAFGYFDRNGCFYLRGGERKTEEFIKKYRNLQYHNVFEQRNLCREFFEVIDE